MKYLMFAIPLSMALLISCTKTLYTHEEYMGRYKTQQEIVTKFGIPTEKFADDTTEQWLYKFINDYPDRVHPSFTQVTNASSHTVKTFTEYDSFVIFTFDKHGKVMQWYAKGIDFTHKKVSAGRTVGLIAGIAAVLLFIGLTMGPMHFDLKGY